MSVTNLKSWVAGFFRVVYCVFMAAARKSAPTREASQELAILPLSLGARWFCGLFELDGFCWFDELDGFAVGFEEFLVFCVDCESLRGWMVLTMSMSSVCSCGLKRGVGGSAF